MVIAFTDRFPDSQPKTRDFWYGNIPLGIGINASQLKSAALLYEQVKAAYPPEPDIPFLFTAPSREADSRR